MQMHENNNMSLTVYFDPEAILHPLCFCQHISQKHSMMHLMESMKTGKERQRVLYE